MGSLRCHAALQSGVTTAGSVSARRDLIREWRNDNGVDWQTRKYNIDAQRISCKSNGNRIDTYRTSTSGLGTRCICSQLTCPAS